MLQTSRPKLTILNDEKLEISRTPGFLAWLVFGLTTSISAVISCQLLGNIFTLIMSIIGEIMFGLDMLGEWEQFTLDKTKNAAILTRCNWIDKLCSRVPERSITKMKLSDIRHVGVSMNLGLFVLQKNGNTISLIKTGLSRREVQEMRKTVHHFLNASRMKCLDKLISPDLYERLLISSESDDDIFDSMSSEPKQYRTFDKI